MKKTNKQGDDRSLLIGERGGRVTFFPVTDRYKKKKKEEVMGLDCKNNNNNKRYLLWALGRILEE